MSTDWATVQPPGDKPAQQEAQAKAETAIRATLTDPDSGKFQNWTPVYKTFGGPLVNQPVWAICVDVNGKNQYGGYAGFRTMQAAFKNGEVGDEPDAISEMKFGCPAATDSTRH